jgi:hypothetical protein
MTTRPAAANDRQPPDGSRQDAIAVPLSFLLWALVVIALAYGVFSTLTKVVNLFS